MNVRPDFDGWIKDKLDKTVAITDDKTGLINSPTLDYTRTITLQILGEIAAGTREHIEDFRHLSEASS